MALIKPADGIVNIAGKADGNVYHRDRSGLHMKPLSKPLADRSPGQAAQRNAYLKAVIAWHNSPWFKPMHREWDLYAQWLIFHNKLGEPYHPTAYQAFLHVNVPRLRQGLGYLIYPPWQPAIDLRPACFGHWNHNDNANDYIVHDDSGHNNHGTSVRITSIMHRDAGKINACLFYVKYYIYDAVVVGNTGLTGIWSTTVWFKLSAYPNLTPMKILRLNNNSYVSVTPAKYLTVAINAATIIFGVTQIQLETWYFLTLTTNGSTYTLYLNNAFEDDGPGASIALSNLMFSTTEIEMWRLHGYLDCISLFDKVLTSEERDFLWNDGNGTEELHN